jgi:hypothetical protein
LYFKIHPDLFDVFHDPVHAHVGHGQHGLHPEQLRPPLGALSLYFKLHPDQFDVFQDPLEPPH